MKKTALVMLALAAFAGSALASGETLEFPASIGKVSFPHKAHQEALKDCQKCHATAQGGKIAGFGKEWAHKTCKECHSEIKKGPLGCKECHKK